MNVAPLAKETVGLWRCLRSSERAASVYFLYVSALAAILPLAHETRLRVWSVNLLLGGLFAYLSHTPAHWRDWLPAPLILLAYKEMGWLAQPHADIGRETAWVYWDRLLLSDWGVQALIESAGPAIPGFLELCYLLVYLMVPVSIGLATIYARDRVEQLTFPLLVTCRIHLRIIPVLSLRAAAYRLPHGLGSHLPNSLSPDQLVYLRWLWHPHQRLPQRPRLQFHRRILRRLPPHAAAALGLGPPGDRLHRHLHRHRLRPLPLSGGFARRRAGCGAGTHGHVRPPHLSQCLQATA